MVGLYFQENRKKQFPHKSGGVSESVTDQLKTVFFHGFEFGFDNLDQQRLLLLENI